MTVSDESIDDLVSLERGEIDRRIFSDAQIFELEMERIFARAWLFLCHESQIPEPGDFFAAVMGRDNGLVGRQKDGSVRAMLNTCPHRGNAVCRAEEGNAKSFLCTYHGWSFGADGSGVGLEVRDDGVGFNPTDRRADSYGMTGMRERAAAIGAVVRVESAPGAGTTVAVELDRGTGAQR